MLNLLNKFFMKTIFLVTLVFSLIVTSCDSKKSASTTSINLKSGKYFSMRQQNEAIYFGLIQLTLPALLKEAKLENGKPIIDEKLKAAIIAQQAEVISKLKSISPDIEILISYKLVLNAIAFTAPTSVLAQIEGVEGVDKIIENSHFERIQTLDNEIETSEAITSVKEKNSVTFIGADKLHKLGFSGQKIKIGIIDTGIDYTHKMFGGVGTKEVFYSINPDTANEHFPNAKVVGGVDFVGSNFSGYDADLERRIPRRDPNPIDERKHGTHVAGTVAGIGDGLTSYSGIAPEALLYSLKVFGTEGSTSDIAVIAALEYAADPLETIDPINRLDVVNLSLGGEYGNAKILYSEAIRNLTNAGTIVVASAGNNGNKEYITDTPATTDEAISTAASIDYMPHNVAIPSVELMIGVDKFFLEFAEGKKGIPARNSNIMGDLVPIGSAILNELSEETKAKAKGSILLMDLDFNQFNKQIEIVQSLGAIGLVIINDIKDENPFKLDPATDIEFPSVMIRQDIGDKIKKSLEENLEVRFNFSTDHLINNDFLIDTITKFSSRGPRSIDSLIKPEIAAPGANIISADMGSGDKVVKKSGTSMAGPHISGVMALLRQAFPNELVQVLKARILNNAKILMENDVHVPVARQGAGRIQADEAYLATVVATPATLSLGEVPVTSQKVVSKNVTLTNTSEKDEYFVTKIISSKNIKGSVPYKIKVKAKSTTTFTISFILARSDSSLNNIEADGFLILSSANNPKISIPFLAVLNKVSEIKASSLVTQTKSKSDEVKSEVKLTLTNLGMSSGDALIFNLLGQDDRQTRLNSSNLSLASICDLEAAGIRIVEKADEGQTSKVLQIGVKLYDSMTFWDPCDVSLQIDSDDDGIADQELLGIKSSRVEGIKSLDQYNSILLDAKKAREIRYNSEILKDSLEDYTPALMSLREMKFYNHSSVALIETDLSRIIKDKNNKIRIRLAVTHLDANSGGDDFLGSHGKKWQTIDLSEGALAFYEMPESVTVDEGETNIISMKRGLGNMKALILYPHNTPDSLKDQQSQVLTEKILN